MNIKELNEELATLLNEANEDTQSDNFKVGDEVYISGDYGLYNDKYEIVKITDSHDEEIKQDDEQNVTGAYSCYKPNYTAFQVAKLKQIGSDEYRWEKIDNAYGNSHLVHATDIDSINLEALDTAELANGLSNAFKQKGYNVKFTCKYVEPKDGKKFGKFYFTSNNLLDQCGIWQLAVKEIQIDDFGGTYVWLYKRCLNCRLHFSYKHFAGSNGCDIGQALYNLDTNTWTLELDKDNYK